MTDALDPRRHAVADRVLDQESAARRHLVVALSGAHAYGFPSPDSDLDLKAIHVSPTEEILGLWPPPTPFAGQGVGKQGAAGAVFLPSPAQTAILDSVSNLK